MKATQRAAGGTAIPPAEALAAAREILPWLVEIRRDLHRHPELGLEEHRTAARVQALLDGMGVAHADGIGGTGVVGTIRGTAAGGGGDADPPPTDPAPAVALRGDMDALPIQDAKDVPYRSQVPGKMHACGHDVHTAVLLGAARLLAERADRLPGTVKLLFQPAEETVGGAKLLIAAGALDDPPVAAIFGLHVDSTLPAGTIGVRYGQRNASSDDVTLVVHGRTGHGAYPAGTVDAIVVAAQVVSAVQTVVSRNVDGRDAAVVSFGTVHGGTQGNVIANRVELVGTVRTLDPAIRELVLHRLRDTAEGVAAALGGHAELTVTPSYDALINDDAMVDLVRANAERLVGSENVVVMPRPNMGVEDFAYYLRRVPGAFYSLGVRNEAAGVVHPEHGDRFDIDESALALGVAVQVLNAVAVLEGPAAAPASPEAC